MGPGFGDARTRGISGRTKHEHFLAEEKQGQRAWEVEEVLVGGLLGALLDKGGDKYQVRFSLPAANETPYPRRPRERQSCLIITPMEERERASPLLIHLIKFGVFAFLRLSLELSYAPERKQAFLPAPDPEVYLRCRCYLRQGDPAVPSISILRGVGRIVCIRDQLPSCHHHAAYSICLPYLELPLQTVHDISTQLENSKIGRREVGHIN